MDLLRVVEILREKRSIFHSEADFQFALAWEIQETYPLADVRLEYPPENEPNRYIDILVRYNGYVYPIELKYPTKKRSAVIGGELFNLKDHGAQDLGKYDFVKDLCRIESFARHLKSFRHGYVLWLTNDPSYWTPPRSEIAGYAAFSVHNGARKSGVLAWGSNLGIGTIKGREAELLLKAEYEIQWRDYSELDGRAGVFKYVLLQVKSDGSIENP